MLIAKASLLIALGLFFGWMVSGASADVVGDILRSGSFPRHVNLSQLAQDRLEDVLKDELQKLWPHSDRLLEVIGLHLTRAEESRVRDRLVKMFQHCHVETVSVLNPSPSGLIGGLGIKIRNIELDDLKVDTLEVELSGVKLDPQLLLAQGGLRMMADAQLCVKLLVAQNELARRAPKGVHVELKKNVVTVSGNTSVLFMKPSFHLEGSLVETPKNQLIFRPKALSVGILPIPQFCYAHALDKVNPLFDTQYTIGCAKRAIEVHLETAGDVDGQFVMIRLRGKLRPNQSTQAPRAGVPVRHHVGD